MALIMKGNNFIKRIKAKAQVNRYINCSESFHSGNMGN